MAQPADTARGGGRIVEGPDNIANFAPEDVSDAIDATRVNVSQVLEDLGPVALQWYMHVTTLADPFFEGRVPSSRGMELAGDYVTYYMDLYGLEPAFPDEDGGDEWTSYFQPFDLTIRDGPRVTTVEDPGLEIDGRDLTFEKDFVIFGNSGSGSTTAPVTFVGYGIAEGRDDYTSFEEDTDLTGRIALVFRYEPLTEDGRSRWSEEGFSRYSSLRRKLRGLAARGAAGVLVVNPPGAADGRRGLDSIERSSQFGSPMDIPVAQITAEVAEDLMLQGDERTRDLMTMRTLADRGRITTFALSDEIEVTMKARISSTVRRRSIPGRNCGGVLRGNGDLADEWLVIGGHYDHVGRGELRGAGAGNRGKVHPGADDNASGTAGMLVLARLFADAYAEADDDDDLRSILFLAFDAEEQGLLGSRHFTDHPTLDPESITGVMNFDMIGSLRNEHLMVLGSQTADGLENLLRPHIEASGLTVSLSPGSSGRSDEANFIRKEIPGLHFFTGMTRVYHTPGDKYHTINPGGAAKVIGLAHGIGWELVTRDRKLRFTTPGQARTRSRGYADVRLGIRPGMGDDLETGILVEGVSLDTSAHAAGIEKGDILLSWDGTPLDGAGVLFEMLKKHKPGDVVKFEVKRGDEIIVIDVTLKASDEG